MFALERGSLSDLVAGPEGVIAAGCVDDEDGNCARRVLVASQDGHTWTELEFELDVSPDLGLQLHDRVGDRLFALGYGHFGRAGGAMVWTSRDGRSWSRVESSSFQSRVVQDVIGSPVGTLAVGYNAPIDSDNTSGFVTWPVHADGSFGDDKVVGTTDGPALVTGAAWTGEEFLAWGYRDGPRRDGPTTLLASSDGRTWKYRAEIRAVTRGVVSAIAVDGDLLVAVGYEGRRFPLSPRAWTSRNAGRTWRLADVPPGDAAMYTVTVEGSLLIARGMESWGSNQRTVSWSSTDGRAWTRLPDDEDLPAIPGFRALTRVRIGTRVCVAGTLSDDSASRGAIYCR